LAASPSAGTAGAAGKHGADVRAADGGRSIGASADDEAPEIAAGEGGHGLVERLLAQKPKDRNKLYSLHAPEVVCISKGKARTPYEFGCKVGIATTNREGLVLAAKSFEGNPYDGHTLAATVDQAVEIGGVDPERIYVDKGYRGHDYAGSGSVMIAGHKRGLTATMKRELKRRSAIEATIGAFGAWIAF